MDNDSKPHSADINLSGTGRSRVYIIVTLCIVIVIGLCALSVVGMDTLAGIRGFVGGEGLYSKHQKDAVQHLLRHAHTSKAQQYDKFQAHMKALDGAKTTRLELEKQQPDMDLATAGMVGIGVQRGDVPAMARVFRRFRGFEQIERAASIWAKADAAVAELRTKGQAIHRLVAAGPTARGELERGITEVTVLNERLDRLEFEFSAALGQAASWARGVLVSVMAGATLLACVAGLWLGLIGARLITRVEGYARDLKQENWLKDGQAGLDRCMRGEHEERELCREVIRYLAQRLEVQVGAFFLADDQARQQLCASYAYQQRKGLSNSYAPGEGLVGQAALEQEMIRISDIPEDYVRVSSGLGNVAPCELVVQPLVLDGEVLGVLELGSVVPFQERQISLLNQGGRAIALALQGSRARRRVQDLLERSQQQGEELQAQQEELRQANEELEEHTQALQQSEQRLLNQQAELEATNAEIEERGEALETERAEVSRQNRKLERASEALQAKAEELERTGRYKSDFLANMSHELRTPLNSILVLSKLLGDNEGERLDQRQVQFASTIHDAGRELLELINEVLDLSKVEAGKLELTPEDVNITTFLGGLERQFSQVCLDKNIKLTVRVEADSPKQIRTCEQRLGQVVKNFLSNAVKFTSEGGIDLTMGLPTAQDLARLRTPMARHNALAITVSDTGIGIPKEKQDTIFEAFQQGDATTSRKYGGTGLGLTISLELVRLLGGEVLMQSEEGKGSRFTAILPRILHEPAAEAASPMGPVRQAEAVAGEEVAEEEEVPSPLDAEELEPQPKPVAAPLLAQDDREMLRPGDRTILIVEDDASFSSMLAELVRDRGFRCLMASDGAEALQLAEAHDPTGILLDLGLPDMDGMTVMASLKENLATRHIPVHVISGREQKLATLRMGAVGFLRKPAGVAGLHDALKRLDEVASRPVKSLLGVTSSGEAQQEMTALLDDGDLNITWADSGEEALKQLSVGRFDCMVLDLELSDMPGVDLLERVRGGATPHGTGVPVVVHAARELTDEERTRVDRYADRLIIQDGTAAERLLDETALFLHRVEADLPEEKRRMLRMLHDREEIFRGRKVLITDDDMRNVFALSSVLEEKGLELLFANNGVEALERLDEHPDIDLVLMDIMMPEMDGYQATQEIRKQERFATLPIIALTAKAMRSDRARCIEAGASDYLSKPVDSEKLLSVLRVWLYQRRPAASRECAA